MKTYYLNIMFPYNKCIIMTSILYENTLRHFPYFLLNAGAYVTEYIPYGMFKDSEIFHLLPLPPSNVWANCECNLFATQFYLSTGELEVLLHGNKCPKIFTPDCRSL